jgi:hypothetical protein
LKPRRDKSNRSLSRCGHRRAMCCAGYVGSRSIEVSLETDSLNSEIEALYTGLNASDLSVVIPLCVRDTRNRETCITLPTCFPLLEYS